VRGTLLCRGDRGARGPHPPGGHGHCNIIKTNNYNKKLMRLQLQNQCLVYRIRIGQFTGTLKVELASLGGDKGGPGGSFQE